MATMAEFKPDTKGVIPVLNHTDIPSPPSFQEMAQMLTRRQQEAESIFPTTQNHVFIELKARRPIMLAFIGDVHAGGGDIDIDRFVQDVEYVRKNKNVFAFTMGDLTDSFFWNPAEFEQVANLTEQNSFIRSALREMKGSVLVSWGGDHDLWALRAGENPYVSYRRETGAYYMQGVGYVDLKVGDITYKTTGAHRLPGFSMYNALHPQMRQEHFGSSGSDIVASAHTHKKGISQQTSVDYGGDGRQVTYVSCGSYKRSDEYSRKLGFTAKPPEDMGANGLILYPDRRRVDPIWALT